MRLLFLYTGIWLSDVEGKQCLVPEVVEGGLDTTLEPEVCIR